MSRPEPYQEISEEEIQQKVEARREQAKADGARLIETYLAQILVTEDDSRDLEAMQILKETAAVSAEVGLEGAGYVATSKVEVAYEPHALGGEIMEYEDGDGTKKTAKVVGYFRARIRGYKP